MEKTSRQQSVIREYEDAPLNVDPRKTGDAFIKDVMKQCGYKPDEIDQLINELNQK